MPSIKAKDVAFGRLAAPDLDQMEEFLTDFGMVRSARTPTALYMRGTGADGFLHVTHLGEPLEPPPLSPARGPPTAWGELAQTHDDRAIFQASPNELPAIDIHSL